MKARTLALVLVSGAAALYAGMVPRARARAGAARADGARLDRERQALAERLDALERRQQLRQLALSDAQGPADEAALAQVRERVVAALAQSSVSGVQLSVAPGRSPAAVSISLRAIGTQTEVLRLLNRIAHPAGHLVLTAVQLRPAGDREVSVAVDGYSLGGGR